MKLSHTEYEFDLDKYIPPARFEQILKFTRDKETPFLVVDLKRVREQYLTLQTMMPYAAIYYAVKANPLDEVIVALRDLGASFDIATSYELDQMLRLGIAPERISYGNTIKKAREIRYAYEKGINLYATDSESDVRKLAENAPGARVFFRLMTEGSGADWPLSRKFGAHPDSIFKQVLLARRLGLQPYGISFHVGSQQRDVGQWDDAIARCHYLFHSCQDEGIELKLINLGGGFPSNYISPTQDIEVYAKEITRFLQEDFPDQMPEIIIEPGRYVAGDAGVLVTEIIMISQKSPSNLYNWVYLDIGKFGGLIETLDESIKYPIYSDKRGRGREVILAGPTCDSMDILYENYKYLLPESIAEGDRLYLLTTGAYTQSYSAYNFNGIPPLKAFVFDE
ncbi:MAG: type III PLP-dependent enzyme [Candidatus Sumerlaeota bacterium]|nr:type III PLP-dependent enzyme [Candidatus Sumerlaeota bacterium]